MYRRLTLHQLVIFEVLARHGNMTRAAEELHLTTPALSIQVKQMAETIGLPLHEQVGKKLYLTEAGVKVEQAARDVLERLKDLTTELAELQGLEQGSLKITMVTTAKYFVPRLLGDFCRLHPGIEVSLEILNRDQCLSRFHQNLDDLYIMGRIPSQLDVESISFMKNPLVVIAPAEHRLAKKKNIPPEELADEFFIMREQGSGTRLAAEDSFKERKIKLKTRMTLGSNEAIKQSVAGGLGLSVLSAHTLELDSTPGTVAILDVKDFPLVKQWNALYPAGKRVSTITQSFLDYLVSQGDL